MAECDIRARLIVLYRQAEEIRKEINQLVAQLPIKDLEYWMDQEVDITVPERLWRF